MATRFIWALLGSALTALPVQADDAVRWVERMANAQHEQNFQGVFVYERGGVFSSHAIWHRVDTGGQVLERLLQLDGAPLEVVRLDGRPQCSTRSLSDQLQGSPLWADARLDPARLLESYDVRVLGQSRVAGHDTVALAVTPRDRHRYAYRLHLERSTALPVKSLLLNDQGGLLERFQFTSLSLDAAPAEHDLQPSEDCQPMPAMAEQVAAPSSIDWQAGWLPAGFQLLHTGSCPNPAGPQALSCMVYSDGLARFSVFIEPLGDARIEGAQSSLGLTVAVSKRLESAQAGNVMATVVGEIPLGTAERIALSMTAASKS